LAGGKKKREERPFSVKGERKFGGHILKRRKVPLKLSEKRKKSSNCWPLRKKAERMEGEIYVKTGKKERPDAKREREGPI